MEEGKDFEGLAIASALFLIGSVVMYFAESMLVTGAGFIVVCLGVLGLLIEAARLSK